VRFRATLEQSGKTATGIPVPETIVKGLGGGKRPPVRVTINGHTYRSSIAPMDGRFMLGVSAEDRAKAKISGGDVVDVDVELDTAPREVDVPKDLVTALRKDAKARATFEELSYSNQRWHVESIESAKTDETRQRRIAKSIAALREGRPR
jgi:hypothetical protein